MDAAATCEMLQSVCDAVIGNTARLTAADKEIGDGDHGIGMERGFKAAREKLEAEAPGDVGAVFKAVGMAVMSQTGGAAGAIFGTFFRSMGKTLEGQAELDAENLGRALEEACEAVKTRGEAKLGDKTMIDALEPAVVAAKKDSGSLSAALQAAAAAAEQGVEATKDLVATTGKARSLGKRSLGHADPGAISLSIILRTMADFVGQRGA